MKLCKSRIEAGHTKNSNRQSTSSCRRKPPAHPPTAQKPARMVLPAATVPRQTEVARPVDYDHSIWNFLQPDNNTDPDSETPSRQPGVQNSTSRSHQAPEIITTQSDEHALKSNNHSSNDHVTTNADKSIEQYEAVREIVETEISYGNDLAIIRNVCWFTCRIEIISLE